MIRKWRRNRETVIPYALTRDPESLVEEGLLLVTAAIRMRITNELIMRAIRHDEPFDRELLLDVARTEMATIASQKAAEAAVLEGAHARASRRSGRPAHSSDYQRDDLAALGLRRRIDEGIVEALAARSSDGEYLEHIIGQARTMAMDEMFRTRLSELQKRVASASQDPERAARIQGLGDDLRRLAEERRGAA